MNVRALALSALMLGLAAPVVAQERPTASILQTQRSSGVDEGTGGAFDRMVRQRLDALGVVRVSGSVVLDLEQVQIALGCMGETAQCMAAVTSELGVNVLLVPSLDRTDEQLVASVLLFDARDQSQRRAIRQASSQTALLEEVEPMLRELFGLPPIEEHHEPGAAADETPQIPPPAGLSVVPFVLIGVGAAALVGGAISGWLAQSDGDAFARASPRTEAEVNAAYARRAQAETEALAANVLFIAGGAIAAGGLVWLLAAGNEDGSSPLAVMPYAGPDGGGLVLAGALGGTN